MLNDFIYDSILYCRPIKKAVVFTLKQPLVVRNPLYSFFYQKMMQKKMALFKDKPHRVMVENTNICNADCVFCPHEKMKRKTGVMAMELFKKIIDECANMGIGYVTIYGFGEPLLDNKFIERVKYAKEVGLSRVTTNTNAAFLTKDKAKTIIEAGLDEIYISFDAATKETYKKIRPNLNFEEVTKNIINLIKEKKKLQSKKPLIYLSFVENGINCHETELYKRKWRKLVNGISFSAVHNWTGEVNFGKVEPTALKDPCRLLWTDMVVSFDGRIPLCCNDYENKVVLGDINRQSIGEIWGGEKLKKIRQKHQKGEFKDIAICSSCQYNYHHKSPWWIGK